MDNNNDEEDSKIFPQKLMDILCDPDAIVQEAICWLPHGKAFIIRNRGLFEVNIMPRFFNRKAKYSSFTRKLNRWNFSRVSSGPELGAYYHEFFRRDRPHLAAQMFCKNPRTMLAMAESRAGRGGTGGAEDLVVGSNNHQSETRHSVETHTSNTASPDLLQSSNVGFSGLSLQNAAAASLSSGMPGLAAGDLEKLSDSTRVAYGSGPHHPGLVSLVQPPPQQPPSTQMLERQILMLQQQEEVNRMLLERALFLRQHSQQLAAHNVAALGGAANVSSSLYNMYNNDGLMHMAEEQKLQDEQSIRLRQLLGLQPGSNRSRNERRNQKPSNNRASAA